MTKEEKIQCPECGKYLTESHLTNHYFKVHASALRKISEQQLQKISEKRICISCLKERNPVWVYRLDSGKEIAYCRSCKDRVIKPKNSADLLDRDNTTSSAFGMWKRK